MTNQMKLFKERFESIRKNMETDPIMKRVKSDVVFDFKPYVKKFGNVYIAYNKVLNIGDVISDDDVYFNSIFNSKTFHLTYFVQSTTKVFNNKDSALDGKCTFYIVHALVPTFVQDELILLVEKEVEIFFVNKFGYFNIADKETNISLKDAIYECFKNSTIMVYPSYESRFFEVAQKHIESVIKQDMKKEENKDISGFDVNIKFESKPLTATTKKQMEMCDVYVDDKYLSSFLSDYSMEAIFTVKSENINLESSFKAPISIFGLKTQIDAKFLSKIYTVKRALLGADVLINAVKGQVRVLNSQDIITFKSNTYKAYINESVSKKQDKTKDEYLRTFVEKKLIERRSFKLYYSNKLPFGKILCSNIDYAKLEEDGIYLYDKYMYDVTSHLFRINIFLCEYDKDGNIAVICVAERLNQLFYSKFDSSLIHLPIIYFEPIEILYGTFYNMDALRFCYVQDIEDGINFYYARDIEEEIKCEYLKMVLQEFGNTRLNACVEKIDVSFLPKSFVKEFSKDNKFIMSAVKDNYEYEQCEKILVKYTFNDNLIFTRKVHASKLMNLYYGGRTFKLPIYEDDDKEVVFSDIIDFSNLNLIRSKYCDVNELKWYKDRFLKR